MSSSKNYEYEYRIEWPDGTTDFANNGIELDKLVKDCLSRDVVPLITVITWINKR